MNLKDKAVVIMNSAAYWQRIKNLKPIRYWPLWDAAGSSSAVELIAGDNGTPSNVTFGATGIGDGRTAASFNGTTSYIDVYSAALNTAWNGQEFTISWWQKVSGVEIWTEAATRRPFAIRVDASNRVLPAHPSSVDNTMKLEYIAGGTDKIVSVTGLSSTGWLHFALTAFLSGNAFKAFLNGSQFGSTQTGLGTWTGNLDVCVIGAENTTPVNIWSGSLAHVALWTMALTPAQIATLATV